MRIHDNQGYDKEGIDMKINKISKFLLTCFDNQHLSRLQGQIPKKTKGVPLLADKSPIVLKKRVIEDLIKGKNFKYCLSYIIAGNFHHLLEKSILDFESFDLTSSTTYLTQFKNENIEELNLVLIYLLENGGVERLDSFFESDEDVDNYIEYYMNGIENLTPIEKNNETHLESELESLKEINLKLNEDLNEVKKENKSLKIENKKLIKQDMDNEKRIRKIIESHILERNESENKYNGIKNDIKKISSEYESKIDKLKDEQTKRINTITSTIEKDNEEVKKSLLEQISKLEKENSQLKEKVTFQDSQDFIISEPESIDNEEIDFVRGISSKPLLISTIEDKLELKEYPISKNIDFDSVDIDSLMKEIENVNEIWFVSFQYTIVKLKKISKLCKDLNKTLTIFDEYKELCLRRQH